MVANLCADSLCLKKDTCRRYVVDPITDIKLNHATRIAASLKNPNEEICSKYWLITVTSPKTII